ncbi:hypothetical protein [Ralstonia sp.]|uniref:DUF7946 domain-containing protein n=1 Tax=Ralstonia sp. TaxID=54061 RepID=UPI0031D288A1
MASDEIFNYARGLGMSEFGLRFTFEKGIADENRLGLYDASVSLNGIARSLAITTHALVNGEIRTHGESAHGAKFFLLPSRKGSFIVDAAIWIGAAIGSGVVYDFIKYGFQEAAGIGDDAEERSRALQKRIEPTIGELPATLESALSDVHRPIRQDNEMTIKVTRPRGEVLITFDSSTASYLEPHVAVVDEPIVGNVTRYNTLSKWGKFYDRKQGRVISFFLQPTVSEYERSLITWSLHENNLNHQGTLSLTATAVVTSNDRIKRYNVSAVQQI